MTYSIMANAARSSSVIRALKSGFLNIIREKGLSQLFVDSELIGSVFFPSSLTFLFGTT